MKTLHVPFSFAPDPVGGTEVYVEGLCASLQRLGVGAVVAAPGPVDATYDHRGLRVRRFQCTTRGGRLEELYGAGDPVASAAFARLLDDEQPDVVHQHAVSPACSVELMRSAKRRGLPVVFTYHTPTASCTRGTLLRWGTEVCTGHLASAPCAACTLHGLGGGRVASAIAGAVPTSFGELLERAAIQGGIWTAARMTALMRRHQASTAALFAVPDRIISLTPWVTALLTANGVPAERIVPMPHGTAAEPGLRRESVGRPRRFIHLGRLDPVKGTDLLIAAVRAMPETPLELDVIGIVQDGRSLDVNRKLAGLAADDSRIRFLSPVDASEVVDRLGGYDFVVVPSQWLETGPLVVLEAFAAGVPVIGSALGGLLDKVTDGVDGLLVRPFNSVDRWTEVLYRAATDPALPDRLRAGVAAPRRMADVAVEMCAVYTEVLAHRSNCRSIN